MPLIQAWECPSTGKLFKQKSDYQKHLKKLATERLFVKKEAKRQSQKAAFFAKMREDCATVDDIEKFIVEHSDAFWGNGQDRDNWSESRRPKKPFKILTAKISVRWSDSCSNSHNAPLSGVTNWHGKPDKPRGYPGWIGRMDLTYENEPNCWTSSLFEKTGICMGGGGGGSSSYTSSITLFADDWPTMEKIRSDKAMLSRLLEPGQRTDDYY